ncbi:hypothetical protein L211DRAFT_863969 [Terfezia boudieri ATCC MYA-4762]|uniref:Uncharacterized protein n=1 Tax=Terfezia boudieri ATCC MYA-4762 TaxID=1051890 RepID=A0A3N4M2P7_9PEZI|nr:hypothetical protein L211DRAFT_863969 [Terfezia boudieri ATCC MYA-4762]
MAPVLKSLIHDYPERSFLGLWIRVALNIGERTVSMYKRMGALKWIIGGVGISWTLACLTLHNLLWHTRDEERWLAQGERLLEKDAGGRRQQGKQMQLREEQNAKRNVQKIVLLNCIYTEQQET